MERIEVLTHESYAKMFFSLDKYRLKLWVENSVSAIP